MAVEWKQMYEQHDLDELLWQYSSAGILS